MVMNSNIKHLNGNNLNGNNYYHSFRLFPIIDIAIMVQLINGSPFAFIYQLSRETSHGDVFGTLLGLGVTVFLSEA